MRMCNSCGWLEDPKERGPQMETCHQCGEPVCFMCVIPRESDDEGSEENDGWYCPHCFYDPEVMLT